jgi:hypothetical protein
MAIQCVKALEHLSHTIYFRLRHNAQLFSRRFVSLQLLVSQRKSIHGHGLLLNLQKEHRQGGLNNFNFYIISPRPIRFNLTIEAFF